MSTDPKIDLFAVDLFAAMWKHHGLVTAETPQRPPSEFNENVFRAVQVRLAMFHSAYEAIFENTHVEFAGNASYFYDAIADFFPHYRHEEEDPEEESVMCMFLSSCAFVAHMCMMSKWRGDDFLEAGREAWAMFADLHLSEAFHAAGGWKALQSFAQYDLAVYEYTVAFSDVVDCHLGKGVMFHLCNLTCAAVESFNAFEEGVADDEDAPYALKWVDFCVREPFVKVRSPDFYSQPIPSVFDKLEAAIWSLSYICGPLEQDDFFSGNDFVVPAGSKTGLTERCFKKTLGLDGESESENCATNNETPRTTSSRVSLDGVDQEKQSSDICEQVVLVKNLPLHEQTDPEVIKTVIYNKITSMVDDLSVESTIVGADRGLEEALSGLLSRGIVITPDDLSRVRSANDREDAQSKMNMNPDDFDTITDPSRREKYPDSKIRVKCFVKTVDQDNATAPDERPKTPKPGLLSPLTSPSVNVLNTPERPLFRRMNSTGSEGMRRKRSVGKENSPSHPPKTDIKKKNSPCKKHIMVTNPQNLGAEANGQEPKGNKEEKYTERDSFSPDHLSSETSISIDRSLPIPKFISIPRNLYSINDETDDSSKDDQDPALPGENIGECDELVSLDKYGGEPYERTKWLELKNKIKSQISFNAHLDEGMTSKATSGQSKTENVDKADTINVLAHKSSFPNSQFESLPKISACENSLRCRTYDINEKSSLTQFVQTSSCLKAPRQDSILRNDDENYHILEKTFKITEPIGKNDLSRLPIEKEFKRTNRRISQDSSGTEIYELTGDENFPTEPTMENQFKDPDGKRTNKKSFFTQFEQSSSLSIPRRNSILTNDDENYDILEKSLTVFGPAGKKDLPSYRKPPAIEKVYELRNQRISRDSSSAEIYEEAKGGKRSEDPTVENQVQSGAGDESKSSFKTKLYYGKLLGKTESKMSPAKPANKNPVGLDGKEEKKEKSKKESNSKGSNREALQTTEKTTTEPVLENPVGFSSKPQDVEKKGKTKRQKKRLTRLEQRIKEEGEGVLDVTRMIFAVGHQPGMASVAAAFHDSKKANL